MLTYSQQQLAAAVRIRLMAVDIDKAKMGYVRISKKKLEAMIAQYNAAIGLFWDVERFGGSSGIELGLHQYF